MGYDYNIDSGERCTFARSLNAGITGLEAAANAHDPENASLDDWRAVHRTNLDGVFLGCKYAIRAMRSNGLGSIINISSRSGLVGIAGAAAYAHVGADARVRGGTRDAHGGVGEGHTAASVWKG